MFRTKIYAGPENFTHPPDVMDVTFRRYVLCYIGPVVSTNQGKCQVIH